MFLKPDQTASYLVPGSTSWTNPIGDISKASLCHHNYFSILQIYIYIYPKKGKNSKDKNTNFCLFLMNIGQINVNKSK